MSASAVAKIRFARALGSRPFALLWTGQTISALGDGAYITALGWEVLLLTHSPARWASSRASDSAHLPAHRRRHGGPRLAPHSHALLGRRPRAGRACHRNPRLGGRAPTLGVSSCWRSSSASSARSSCRPTSPSRRSCSKVICSPPPTRSPDSAARPAHYLAPSSAPGSSPPSIPPAPSPSTRSPS